MRRNSRRKTKAMILGVNSKEPLNNITEIMLIQVVYNFGWPQGKIPSTGVD